MSEKNLVSSKDFLTDFTRNSSKVISTVILPGIPLGVSPDIPQGITFNRNHIFFQGGSNRSPGASSAIHSIPSRDFTKGYSKDSSRKISTRNPLEISQRFS